MNTPSPKFSTIYSGEWNHHPSMGVGLKLSGVPTDPIAFFDIMHGESCNPVATRRILDELIHHNIKYTTVRSHLDFDYIASALKEINVTLEIVAPKEVPNTSEIDSVVLYLFANDNPKDIPESRFSENEKQQITMELKKFKESIKKLDHDFGCFQDNRIKNKI